MTSDMKPAAGDTGAAATDPPRSARERQRLYHRRRLEDGLKKVSVYVPADRVAELRAFAARLRGGGAAAAFCALLLLPVLLAGGCAPALPAGPDGPLPVATVVGRSPDGVVPHRLTVRAWFAGRRVVQHWDVMDVDWSAHPPGSEVAAADIWIDKVRTAR